MSSRSLQRVRVFAVAAENGSGLASPVAAHFGRCPFYVVVVTKDAEIRAARAVENPFVQSHAPGEMIGFLRNLGTDTVVVGKEGPGATHCLQRFGIDEEVGASGSVADAVGEQLASRADATHLRRGLAVMPALQ